MDERIYNEKAAFKMLKLFGVGLIVIIGYIALNTYFKNKEYPQLRTSDSFESERIRSFTTDRGAAFVEFESGLKNTFDWGQNLNYKDYPTIVSILSIGDLVSKRANSDTIVISHSGKEYFYILRQMIEKRK